MNAQPWFSRNASARLLGSLSAGETPVAPGPPARRLPPRLELPSRAARLQMFRSNQDLARYAAAEPADVRLETGLPSPARLQMFRSNQDLTPAGSPARPHVGRVAAGGAE